MFCECSDSLEIGLYEQYFKLFLAFVDLTLQHSLPSRFPVLAHLYFFALHSNRCKPGTMDCHFNLISVNLKGDFMNDWFRCPDVLGRVRCQT